MRLNRELVLKDFLEKISKAKKMRLTEVKVSVAELDDIAFILYELMSEKISKILSLLDEERKEKKVEPKKIVYVNDDNIIKSEKNIKINHENDINLIESIQMVEDIKNDETNDDKDTTDETNDDYLFGGSF
jgi:hypothetical protein